MRVKGLGKKSTSTAILLAMFSLAISTSILHIAPVTVQAASTPPPVEWIQTYGGGSSDRAYSIQQTTDRGYIIAGNQGTEYWLLKTNSTGAMEWNNVYNTGQSGYGSAQQTSDGGYIMSGSADAPDDTASYGWLMKTSPTGSTQWSKNIASPTSNHNYANSFQQTSDGGYVIAGRTSNAGKGFDAWLAKLNSAGGLQWSQAYGGADFEEAYSVQQARDGGYVLAGCIWSETFRTYDFLLVKTDSSGAAQWSQTYGKGLARSVRQTSDGGFIATGYINPTPDNPSANNGWVVKTNSTGGLQWSKTISAAGLGEFWSVELTNDGGYILAGTSNIALAKMNSTGAVEWSLTYQGSFSAVQQTSDGGYVAAGTGPSPVRMWDGDLLIVKFEGPKDTDADGLLDDWEKNGIDYNNDGITDLDLKALGADWQHKDLFVEVDYMGADHFPDSDAINDVVAAFANAPVTNPDGLPGIKLHVQVDDQIPHQDTIKVWVDFDSTKDSYFGTATQRSNPKSSSILDAKAMVYRYCLFTHQFSLNDTGTWTTTEYSGIAELPGNDFVVSLGTFTNGRGTKDEQAGTFMHELGHTLNLGHGGADDINYKPNYLSIMNYQFQFPWAWWMRPLDYSRSQLPSLYEGSLDEPLGVQGDGSWLYTAWNDSKRIATGNTSARLDWNGDWNFTYLVKANINNFPAWDYTSPADELLNGYDDWANVMLDFRGTEGFTRGAHPLVASHEMTHEIADAMYAAFQAMRGMAVFNVTPSENIWTQGKALSVTVTLGNLGGSDETANVTVYANSTVIASGNFTLKAGNLTTATLPYNGQTLTAGNYTLKAVVSPVANETYTADNTITGSVITVTGTIPELNPTTLLAAFLLASSALILAFRKKKTRTLQLAH